MFLLPIDFLISSSNVQHQNYQSKQFHYFYKKKQPNVYQYFYIHQDLLHKPHPLFV